MLGEEAVRPGAAGLDDVFGGLNGVIADGTEQLSSDQLAALAGVNAAKVRKDLSYLGSYGTRGVGYDVAYLVYQIKRELGLHNEWKVVVVGAGNLGNALANYSGFTLRGFPRSEEHTSELQSH